MYEGNYEALANAIIKQAVKDSVLRSADGSGWSCAAASDHEGNR